MTYRDPAGKADELPATFKVKGDLYEDQPWGSSLYRLRYQGTAKHHMSGTDLVFHVECWRRPWWKFWGVSELVWEETIQGECTKWYTSWGFGARTPWEIMHAAWIRHGRRVRNEKEEKKTRTP